MREKEEILRERRKNPRLPLRMRVKYSSARDFFEDYSSNISVSGMFINTQEPVEYGTKVLLEFDLPEIPIKVRGLGEVVRVIRDQEAERESSGMGIKFLKFDPESEAGIREFISRRTPKSSRQKG